MERPQKHQSYGSDKFEGEPCYTRIAYFWVMNGDGDFVGANEGENTLRLDGPFTLQDVVDYESETNDVICLECLTNLLKANSILSWESSDGFAYSQLE